jgi:apolipoprotein N-acyltransferase
MDKSLFNYITAAIVSGILIFFSVAHVNFIINWICFVPLFCTLVHANKKQAFRAGFITGLTIALPSFYWMIPGAQRFTGSSSLYGMIVFLFSAALLAVYFGFINYLFIVLRSKKETKYSFVRDAFLIAAIYTIAEALLMNITTGMPWFGFHSGNGLLENIYSIQPASVFGMHILSFVAVLVNYSIASAVIRKKWRHLSLPAAIIVLYMGWGYILFNNTGKKNSTDKAIKVAILNENIPPEIKWDDNNGNKLVASLLKLDSIAASQSPDIILWSESAIPWTYRKDDDLVKELLRISASSKPTHLLGMNTDYENNEVYNSVYAIAPDGAVQGRYDKRYLLSFIESSFAGFSFPFFSSSGFMVQQGESNEPLQTAYGNAGVMICNESTLPQSAASMVIKGADFLVNLSNDGWFSDTYLTELHFWNVKLRAVETRRDIAFNSNNGYTGLVNASGEVILKEKSNEPFVKMISVNTHDNFSLAAEYPFLFVYLCVLYIVVFYILGLVKMRQTKLPQIAARHYKRHK